MAKASVERFKRLPEEDRSRVIEMAWEDRTPFEAIEGLYGLGEHDVVDVMRHALKPDSFKLWRRRVSARATKHRALRSPAIQRGYCPTQYKRF
ncbi:TIGR03643 family protein [Halomonas sp. PAMB 3232]|uniref:TIGR03643 family protein n=1 Tax=Halomonas sp. PAMB 3232 TaxID=3075221 RepID=UPI0028A1D853|nr:TIGR03643 family protein [Halomonas sp. PAMB 3232]WNL39587.1 TIGR03643 family protein [Halomonas sp. PAMB 3232]